MPDLLTTQELQAILQVDRTTIYRMVGSGKLPAIRVGNQWRFPREEVESWLQRQSCGASQTNLPNGVTSVNPDPAALFPLECVQLVQDAFADALGVTMVTTDLAGRRITRPSNLSGLCAAVEASPTARERCGETWAAMAQEPGLTPRFMPGLLGLLWARGLIRVHHEIRAMLVVGGVAPAHWPPAPAELKQAAQSLDLDLSLLQSRLDEVHRLDAQGQAHVLSFVQRVADIFSHIATERSRLLERLQRIAEITRL
ncbi:MAG: PocR ligand-binding domain-containing protein [Caldilineales bacterium]|nr:PocR ligand-binding domain-containing protein [Caldilineales bacterium]MDW8319140.1 PocR ligand-binding domain-containing protein [Anaerolineae bacterium]